MSEGLSRRRGHGASSQGTSAVNGGSGSGAGPSSSSGAGRGGGAGSLSPTMMDSASFRRSGTPNNSNHNSDNTSKLPSTSSSSSSNNNNGHKIAFDPLDLETRNEEAQLPKLTLMEEIILLGIKE